MSKNKGVRLLVLFTLLVGIGQERPVGWDSKIKNPEQKKSAPAKGRYLASVFLWKQHGCCAAVGFGDYPELLFRL